MNLLHHHKPHHITASPSHILLYFTVLFGLCVVDSVQLGAVINNLLGYRLQLYI